MLANARLVGATVKTHAAASCDTLTVWPATVIVPLRRAPVLAAAVKVTVPEPVPEVTLGVSLGAGAGRATMWTCDLNEGYVRINGNYLT